MARSLGIRVPAWVAKNITTMQILQFVITHFILFHVAYLWAVGAQIDMQPIVFWLVLGAFLDNVYSGRGTKEHSQKDKYIQAVKNKKYLRKNKFQKVRSFTAEIITLYL